MLTLIPHLEAQVDTTKASSMVSKVFPAMCCHRGFRKLSKDFFILYFVFRCNPRRYLVFSSVNVLVIAGQAVQLARANSLPMDEDTTSQDDLVMLGSCAARVSILIDVADFAAKKGPTGSARDATLCVDGLRLSVLRVLTQLYSSCPKDSWLEWSTHFFDSRHNGIGKTPSGLRARLKSRLASRRNRGFTRVSHTSFQAFGEACLAVAVGVQGDPLARDQETALKRWARGRKDQPPECQSTGAVEPNASRGFNSCVSRSGDEGPRQMYHGHDMSSHEVVVRSLLEVLQEFGEAEQGDRTGASPMHKAAFGVGAPKPQQLLLLHRGCPRTDDDVERFVLQGNFTPEAAAFDHKSPEDRGGALMKMLDAQLGKAILSAGARGMSFLWQDTSVNSDNISIAGESPVSVPHKMYLHRCLSAAGSRGVIGWERVFGGSILLPPSAALGKYFCGPRDRRDVIGSSGIDVTSEQRRAGTTIGVALNLKGITDVHIISTPLYSRRGNMERYKNGEVAEVVSFYSLTPASQSTPWRLMGTVSIDQVWPLSLVDQNWGATALFRGAVSRGEKRWRDFLRELGARDTAAVVILPCGLFRANTNSRDSGDDGKDNDIAEAPTVALIVPVTEECALGWSVEGLEHNVTKPEVTSLCTDDTDRAARINTPSKFPVLGALGSTSMMGRLLSGEEGQNNARAKSHVMQPTGSVGSVAEQAQLMLGRREREVSLAIEETLLARRRRRQARSIPGLGVRGGGSNVGSSISGAANRRLWSGGINEGPLSPRETGSFCSTGECVSGERAADSTKQWRLEAFFEGSRLSGSTRGCRLFASDVETAEEDEIMSITDSRSGPQRALEDAPEDVSSRSSQLGPDSDSSILPDKISRERSAGATSISRSRDDVWAPGIRSDENPAPMNVNKCDAAGVATVAGDAVGELPLSFMSEPALACVPGPPLTADLMSLGMDCALANANIVHPMAVPVHNAGGKTDLIPRMLDSAESQSVGAKRNFIDAVRFLERVDRFAEPRGVEQISSPPVPSTSERAGLISGRPTQVDTVPRVVVNKETCSGEKGSFKPQGHNVEVAGGFEHRLSSGVCGLLKQYREVVESGQRSPVDFVVHTVPKAVHDMTEDSGQPSGNGDDSGDRYARAAQVLAAVVSGLTCTPEELSLKYKSNRGAQPAMDAGAGMAGAVAKPSIQKIRDYQLQALLLCQFHTMAMDLPDNPESAAVFSALEASGRDKIAGESRAEKGKGKGKGKRRRRKDGGQKQTGAPQRPSDPFPDHRRARLVDLLRPISTLLDTHAIVDAPLVRDGAAAEGSGGGTDRSRSRAYDGTIADFMGFALTENFAPRLPRTLVALFEDFEYHPPDALFRALEGGCREVVGAVEEDKGKDVGSSNGTNGLKTSVDCDPSREGDSTGSTLTDAEPAGLRLKTTSGGILLSDRTPMSHNYFKNSGVLNGFPKVKVKSKAKSGLPRHGVSRGVSDKDGTSTYGVSGSLSGFVKGKWRDANDRGDRPRNGTSRTARGSSSNQEPGCAVRNQVSAAQQAPSSGVRDSPRLHRHRQTKNAHLGSGSKAHTSTSVTKGSSPSAGSNADAMPCPAKCPQSVGPTTNVPRVMGSSGILVGETPRKSSTRKRSLRDSAPQSLHCDSRGAPVEAVESAGRKPSTFEAPGHLPCSPAGKMQSPAAAGTAAKRRAVEYSSPQLRAAASLTGMISPSSLEAASAATRLFVAESPGTGVPEEVCITRRSVYAEGGAGSMSRNLMPDSVSPAPQRRSVVPDTPA